jgi:hypothetical protein
MPCVFHQEDDIWTVDETHPAYPHPRDQPPQTFAAAGNQPFSSALAQQPRRISPEEAREARERAYTQYQEVLAEAQRKKKTMVAAGKGGAGTELKKLLSKVGIKSTPTCSCNKRAEVMDQQGIQWCKDNVDKIVGWLREEATKRRLPFIDMAGKLIVNRAISMAEKAEKKYRQTTAEEEQQDV